MVKMRNVKLLDSAKHYSSENNDCPKADKRYIDLKLCRCDRCHPFPLRTNIAIIKIRAYKSMYVCMYFISLIIITQFVKVWG